MSQSEFLLPAEIETATEADKQGYSMKELKTGLAHTIMATTESYVHQHSTPVSSIRLRAPERG